jgi:hypothetical protein
VTTYRIFKSTYYGGHYYKATPEAPALITIPDNVKPAPGWTPVINEAQARPPDNPDPRRRPVA